MEESNSWKVKTLALGAVVGAVAGLLAALLIVQRAEQEQAHPKLSAGEGVKLGLGLLGLLKMLSE